MPRYIPPHLRNEALTDAPPTAPNERAIADPADRGSSTQRSLAQLQISQPQKPLYTLDEIHEHYNGRSTRSTLNDSSEHAKGLAYVILFHGANPRWKDDKIIFAKTNIDFLPGYDAYQQAIVRGAKETAAGTLEKEAIESGSHMEDAAGGKGEVHVSSLEQTTDARKKPGLPKAAAGNDTGEGTVDNAAHDAEDERDETSTDASNEAKVSDTENTASLNTRPIAVFHEHRFKYTQRKFVFEDYYNLLRVSFLKPKSTELVRMLEQKWAAGNKPGREGRKRDPDAWAASLRQEWAVVQFVRNKSHGVVAPKIEVTDDDETHEDKGKAKKAFAGVVGDSSQERELDRIAGECDTQAGHAEQG